MNYILSHAIHIGLSVNSYLVNVYPANFCLLWTCFLVCIYITPPLITLAKLKLKGDDDE